jgi:digeranylgeranylglycerophospholipid reductase|tara:strand:- start:8940 stop:10130 length:1191 start_codon:yes stop_codon:yes gene_type:complete
MNLISKKFDCIIVGGGPAGSTFADIASQNGLSVLVLEKDREIGVPVRCGEAVSDKGLRIFHSVEKEWINSIITRIRLVAPNETAIEFDLNESGYILDRKIFDLALAKKAEDNGAIIKTEAYVNGLIFDEDKVVGVTGEYQGESFSLTAKIIVGADGVESRVGRWAGLSTHVKLKDMESAIQKTVTGIDVENHIFEFYLSRNWAPGGYLWVFPKGKRSANIGLAISGLYAKEGKSAYKYLQEFLNRKYPNVSTQTMIAGGVPVAKTVKNMVTEGLMLVGDAAHTVNPMTGGGIISGMRSGLLAAETAVSVIKSGQNPTKKYLQKYEKEWHKIGGKNHEKFYRIKESIFRFEDKDLNRIADGIADIPENKRSLFKLFSIAVAKKPSLLLDVARLFAGL